MKIGKAIPYLIVVPLLAVSGCLRNNAPIQFYMLNADSVTRSISQPAPNLQETVVGLGPVRIPEYLNRPQIVLGVTTNQYRLDEQHRWAERLDQNIARVLLQSLSGQLGGAVQIVRFPWPLRQVPALQVSIDILELLRQADGQSLLSAQWTVKNQDRALSDKRFDCSQPVPADDYEAFVKAQSECLTKLSRDIAATLRQFIALGAGNKR